MIDWLTKYSDTKWTGLGELWLDTAGDTAETYDCELQVESHGIHYSWLYENKRQKGCFTLNKSGAHWVDSWHQKTPVECLLIPDTWGIFSLTHEYEVPASPNWAWRSILSHRPDHSLVLQMTNITSWGEEGRAVRMIFNQDTASRHQDE